MTNHSEKRHFIRAQAHCPVRYNYIDSDQHAEGYSLNISSSGILFCGEQPLEPGKAVELRTLPENLLTPPMAAYLEILRCEQDDENGYQIAGAIKGIKAI